MNTVTAITKYNISSIKIINFRNISEYEVHPGRTVALVGNNGVGKSSILEAFSLLYPGNGMRSAKAADIVKFGENYWSVISVIDDGNLQKRIDVLYEGGDKRIRINSKPIEKMAELADNMLIFWLSPEIISNFNLNQQARRSFFDRMVYSFDSQYSVYCNHYAKLISERSQLLKSSISDEIWLNTIEKHIAELMVKILNARQRVLIPLSESLQGNNLIMKQGGKAEELFKSTNQHDVILQNIKEGRFLDKIRGGMCFGTHRTKFLLNKNGVPFDFCSSGEKKAIIMELLFAQINLKINTCGQYPILLFDDILDQFDDASSNAYIERAASLDCQLIMSASNNSFPEFVQRIFL